MILSRRVQLHGVQLDELDTSIVIRSVEPGTPKKNTSAASRMNGVGQRITSDHWESLETVVTWAMDIPKTDMSARRAVFEKVANWANSGGWLQLSNMPGRQMYVDRAVLDGPGDYWDWTRDYKITFKAYNVPFWQGDLTSVTLAGLTGNATVDPGGHEKTVMDATFTNLSGANISYLNIAANVTGGGQILLQNIALPANGQIILSHGTDGVMRIQGTGTTEQNLLKHLKTDSTDDLYLPVGACSIGYTAERYGRMVFSWRGRWL